MKCRFLFQLLVVIGLVTTGTVTGQAQEPQAPSQGKPPDITGVYVCDGVNPEGKPYRGVVEIAKMNNVFYLRWTFPQSSESALGIGIVSNDVLAVSYYGGSMVGVVAYKIEDGKKMVGEWTVVGADGVYKETLMKVSDGGATEPPVHPPVPKPPAPATRPPETLKEA